MTVPLVINWLTGQQMPIFNQTATQGSVIFAAASGVYTDDNSQFFWDDTTHSLGISTATPASVGSTSNVLALNATQKVAVNPLANAVATTSSIVLQVADQAAAATNGGTGLEYAAVFTMASTHNGGSIGPNKVAIYGAAQASGGTCGAIWAINTVTTIASGAAANSAQGYELDFNNLSATARNYTNLATPAYGLSLTGDSTNSCTAGLFIGAFPGNPQWYAGIVFNQQRSGLQAAYGIDLSFDTGNTWSIAAIRMPNNQAFAATNAAASGVINGLVLDGSNIWQVGGTSQVNINGGNLTGTSVAMAIGALSGLGGTGTASISGNPNGGILTLSPSGAGIAASGLFTISWPTAFPTTMNLVLTAMNGTGSWNAVVNWLIVSQSTNQATVQWANNGVNLTGGSTYKFSYNAFGI